MFQLNEDPEIEVRTAGWIGDWHGYVVQLVDLNGSPVDITTGTLSATFTNVASGAAYSFGGGSVTLTKSFASEGIVTVLNPAAYPTAAVVRLTIALTSGATVRRFGPVEVEILAP